MAISVVIVGCGVIGHRLARAFARHEDITISGCCDLVKSKAEAMSDEYKCIPYTSYKEMINQEDPDLVYIGVPPASHFEIASYAIKNARAVICEKPLTLLSDNAKKMVELEEEENVITAVNLPFRYSPGFLKLKRMILEGTLGEIRRVSLKFRFPRWPREWQDVEWLAKSYQGGPLREVGTHYYFALLELFHSVKKLMAVVEYQSPESYERGAWGVIELDNGKLVSLDLLTDVAEAEENTLIIHGSIRTVSFEAWYKLVEILENQQHKVLDETRYDTSYHLVNEVVKSFRGESVDLVSFEDAANAQYILDAILSSNGKWIESFA